MKNNRGVTLTEVIVVVLIIGILGTGAAYGANSLGIGSAKNVTEQMMATLNLVQIENMSMNKVFYMTVEMVNGDYYLIERTSSQVLSKKKLDVINGEISCKIKKSSGEIKEYLISDVPVVGKEVRNQFDVSFIKDAGGLKGLGSENEIVIQIGVKSAGRSFSIRLVELTGKHFIE